MDLLASLLGREGFLPHGYCFTWAPQLLWTMVGADAMIALAYFSMPLVIVKVVRQRGDRSLYWLGGLFSAFIFACGVTHVMDIWTIWQPDYGVQALSKVVTAGVSMVTALALWPLIPRAMKIPSPRQLQVVTGSLEDEVRKRRSAEEHLVDSEQSLAITLSSIGAGFISTDREGRVARMNSVAEHVTGWSQDEAAGKPLWQVFAREGRPSEYLALNPVEVMIQQGFVIDTTHEVVAVSRSGERSSLEVKSALTHSNDGTVRGLAMVFRDMTRFLRAELASNRLAALVESSQDAIIGKTLDGRITSWNAAARNMFGYSAEEAIGRPIQMLLPPDREHEEMRILADLAHGRRVPAFDTVRRAKDGSLLDVSVTISPIRDTQGRIVGASKIARDVSEKHRAEAALRDSEARLRFALESAQIGDWELDLASGIAVRRSLRHDRCFGYDSLQPEWTFDTFAQHVHPDDRADVAEGFHAAVGRGQDWHVECRVVWPDASVHWITAHGSMRREADRPTRMLGIITDVTRHKLAEESRLTAQRLEAENRQILAASELKSQFLANMSHELRTPLNAIIGFADLLHAGAVPVESPKHHQFLGHIGSSGRHLLQLINDVLDLSKVESGKFEFFPEPVLLPPLIKEATDILHTALQRKRISLEVEVDTTLTDLVLDPARLKQVLYNYLSNAIKFTPEGGHVVVRARAEGPAHFRIEVEDSGIGIAAADIPRLFSEFQQLDSGSTKQHQGTGLGLALTRRLVQAQGGGVGVRSTPGRGSVFHLVLARDLGAAQRPGLPVPAQRWLVIEGDHHLQAGLVRGLASSGHDVDSAPNGAQATRQASVHNYDAITLDLLLPDQHGLGVLADIRSAGASSASPVVSVSMPAERGSAASFAIANVLSKPIRIDEVVAAMARFRLPPPHRARVLVIDDDPLALRLMQQALADLAMDTVCHLDGRAALREIDQHRPDAIVLDLMMPEFDGFATLDALRRLPAWADTPVFIWTSMLLTDAEYDSLARSARAVLSKGGGQLAAMLDDLRRWRPPATVLPDRSGP